MSTVRSRRPTSILAISGTLARSGPGKVGSYIWLSIEIDDNKKTLEAVWHDVYDLDVKTGQWTPVEGVTYYAQDATVEGAAFKQEANFASGGLIVTGIRGNDSSVTFRERSRSRKVSVGVFLLPEHG